MAVYGMAYVDLWLRARSAYREGEKYLEWDRKPDSSWRTWTAFSPKNKSA